MRESMTDVYVFGSVNRDLIAAVDALPRAGETIVSAGFRRSGGGKGANQAYAAARLAAPGTRVHLVACVGRDDDGRALIRELGDAGVDTRYVFEVDAPTGLAMIEVAADGENTIVVVPGANHAWRPELVGSVPLRPGDLVVCQLEIPLEIVADVAESAHASGSRFIVNAAPYEPRIADIAPLAEIVIVNEGEAAALLGDDEFRPERLAATRIGGGDVIVTLGDRGSLVRTADGRLSTVGAYPAEVVDTVGAGDAFVGALAAVLADGGTVKEAVDTAMAAGALTVSADGARHPGLDNAAIAALRARTTLSR
jgi:ribokinase